MPAPRPCGCSRRKQPYSRRIYARSDMQRPRTPRNHQIYLGQKGYQPRKVQLPGQRYPGQGGFQRLQLPKLRLLSGSARKHKPHRGEGRIELLSQLGPVGEGPLGGTAARADV